MASGRYLHNLTTPYRQAIAERLQNDRAFAPALLELELTNVLRSSCLRRQLSLATQDAGLRAAALAAGVGLA